MVAINPEKTFDSNEPQAFRGFLEQVYTPEAFGRCLTDAYHPRTIAGFVNEGRHNNKCVSYLFGRKEAGGSGYTVATGQELMADLIKRWQNHEFTQEDIDFYRAQVTPEGKRVYTDEQIDAFLNCDVKIKFDVVPEGSLLFPQEPMARLEGPIGIVKMLEPALLCIANGQSAYSSHAARLVEVISKPMENGSPVGYASVQGLRRGPSIGAAIESSRALEAGGYTTTSTGVAAKILGQVYAGTMDHAWVMTHGHELGKVTMAELLQMEAEGRKEELQQALANDSFRSFAFTHRDAGIFLCDTYNPKQGLENAITVMKELHALGLGANYGVRFDSDDLVGYSKLALRRYAEEGLLEGLSRAEVDAMSDAELLKQSHRAKAFCAAADGIDEYTAQEMREQGCFYKYWGVGTGGSHVPPLGMVDKVSAMFMDVPVNGVQPENPEMTPLMKVAAHAPVKSSNPGLLNSRRFYKEDGTLSHVVIYDEALGLDPSGKAVNLHNFDDVRIGMSNIGGTGKGILVPMFDKDGQYVYEEPKKRETFKGSNTFVTDLKAIAAKVKEQIFTLPEGVRRVVRPRNELRSREAMKLYSAALKQGVKNFTVDVEAIENRLPPEVEHIPVFLDQKLFEQRRACEAKHNAHSTGVAQYTERFQGGNEEAAPSTGLNGNADLVQSISPEQPARKTVNAR